MVILVKTQKWLLISGCLNAQNTPRYGLNNHPYSGRNICYIQELDSIAIKTIIKILSDVKLSHVRRYYLDFD